MKYDEPSLFSLADLDASHNTLQHIPYKLFHLPQLVNLSLSYNLLERLPGDLDYNTNGNINLYLSYNVLERLPGDLDYNTNGNINLFVYMHVICPQMIQNVILFFR